MKKALAIALCFVILSNILINLSALVWYEIEKTYIVNELCENRENSSLKCNGNCALNKVMISSAPVQNQNENNLKISVEILNFIIPENKTLSTACQVLDVEANYASVFHSSEFKNKIFHPPKIG